MSSSPMSTTRAQTLLSQRAKLLTNVCDALSGGPPINWAAGERAAYTAQLRGLGFHLVTKGQARARGIDIPSGTPPVGRGEFGPPLSQFLDLYILELHTSEPVEELPPEAKEVAVTPPQPNRIRKKKKRSPASDTVRSEAKSEIKTEIKTETKTETKTEVKPEVKTEPPPKTAKAQWLTTTEAADYLGKTSKAMQMMRYQHAGPAYQRNGSNVMYRSTDLDAWLATKRS